MSDVIYGVLIVVAGLLMVAWPGLSVYRAQRRCDSENERLHATWLRELAEARANKTLPPFPPNRLVLR